MRKNFGAKAILYPMPVLIIGTYDENGNPNAMNAAWGGISEETQKAIKVISDLLAILADYYIKDKKGELEL